jgi:hypothetical protein
MMVGIGALYGGWSLLTNPAALGADPVWLEGSPFPDFTVPGLVLLVVIGGGMLVTALLAIFGARSAVLATLMMGAILMAWGMVETIVIGYQGTQQVVLVMLFVVVPAAILLWLGVHASRIDQG